MPLRHNGRASKRRKIQRPGWYCRGSCQRHHLGLRLSSNGQAQRRGGCLPRPLQRFVSALCAAGRVIVRPNPHPQEIFPVLNRQGSIRLPHAGRPHVADLLELPRGRPEVARQEAKVLVGKGPDRLGQGPIMLPKPRSRPMPHSSCSFPGSLAAPASRIRKSSFPTLEPASIC